MIRYQISDGDAFPRVFCDVCQKPIDDPYGLAHISASGEITFAHAGRCDRKVKRTQASANGSENLIRLFARLLRNTRIGSKELHEAESILGDGFIGVVTTRTKLERKAR